jgi:hypothetical protein
MKQTIIELWKESKIDYLEFKFSCGGDSMNDTEITIYNDNNDEVSNSEISDFIDNEVYNNVEFYENSDGHYIGESGEVIIRLNEDGDDFEYSKNSRSEWSEQFTEQAEIELTDDEVKFIQENVNDINGHIYDGVNTNYKRDFIMTDKEETMISELEKKINDFSVGYDFGDNIDGVESEWCVFTTGDEIELNGNKLKISISKEFYVYTEE